MRRALAAVLDVAVIAVAGYALFRLAEQAAPCGTSGVCPALAPITVVLLLALLLVYFGASYLLWKCTPGERLFLR